MRPVPVKVDHRSPNRQAAVPAPEIDVSLWAGVLFWLGFAALSLIAGV